MQRFRLYDGFKKLHLATERYDHAQKIIDDLKDKIKAGWTPFDEEQIIYKDLTQYANVAKVYGQKRKSNLTLNVYLSEFLQETKIKVTPKTFESYQSKTRLFALWLEREKLSENDISAITTEIILKFFSFLINERKLQGRTIQKYGQYRTIVFHLPYLLISPAYILCRTMLIDIVRAQIVRISYIISSKRIGVIFASHFKIITTIPVFRFMISFYKIDHFTLIDTCPYF